MKTAYNLFISFYSFMSFVYIFIYFYLQASDTELLWIQRAAILILGALATAISTSVPIIFGLFVLAGDVVSVIVFPQLTCALFLKFTNTYGAITGFILSLVLRLGAGEYYLNFKHFIEYPWYDDELGQVFPFRVFAMTISFLTIIFISLFTNMLLSRSLVVEKYDFKRCTDHVSKDDIRQENTKTADTVQLKTLA